MNQKIYQFLLETYWKLPLSDNAKDYFLGHLRRSFWNAKRIAGGQIRPRINEKQGQFLRQILAIPHESSEEHVSVASDYFQWRPGDPKILAYYLPQFHPTTENDRWWGKGVTEWNNVSRAVPQYVGHYQPRFPGELGYYDLRLEENIGRQIELAKMYGLYGFAFYFYWFDGKRLLDRPLDMFLRNKSLNFPFCLCWANESWTRRFDGSCGEILIKQSEAVSSYLAFIESVLPYMSDSRYIRIGGRALLIVYRPSFIPNCPDTLARWRQRCKDAGIGDIYIIGVKEHTWDADLLALGFDAQSEFHPGTLFKHCKDISTTIDFIRSDFSGIVMDYADIVEKQRYFHYNHDKLYRAIMPMWDNTARRNNKGIIFEGSSPDLYRRWLIDICKEVKARLDLEEPFIFINAWNEWGEGAYLEPDRRYGYAYLDATRKAIEESRE